MPQIFQAINLIDLNRPIGQKSYHTKNPCNIYHLVERRLNCWKSLLSEKFISLNQELSCLMLISWIKLLFILIVNKRKIQNKLKSLFASLILGFRPAPKCTSTTDKPVATDRCCHWQRPNVAMWTSLPLQACNILLWNIWESLWTLKIHSNWQICHHHEYRRQVVITTRKPMKLANESGFQQSKIAPNILQQVNCGTKPGH